MQHKKLYRTLGLIFMFLFLQAQSCDSFFGGDPTIDCNEVYFATVAQDENGNVHLEWASPPADFEIVLEHDGTEIAIYRNSRYRNGYYYSDFSIDWGSIQGSNTITLELVTSNDATTCRNRYTLQRPAIPSAVSSGMDCANLRLTSPLGGMANGWETFYWDALAGAVNYRINIYDNPDSASPLAGWDAGNVTNLQVNVSGNAIGGETPLMVELIAIDAAGSSCAQRYEIAREAAPPQLAPESTPD